jgi:hypothetical protein
MLRAPAQRRPIPGATTSAPAMPTAAPAAVSETTSTLTPFYGAAYYTEVGEAKRQALNAWIRTSKAYDAVIDFDKVKRDPENPKSDHLHPNDAGYKARETHEPWANRRTEGKFHERRTNKAGDKWSEPRTTRRLSSPPCNHAEPSVGAPL